jgi:hypothetical protein
MEKLKSTEILELTNWLSKNLTCKDCFTPHLDKISEIKSKGIYFWFMKPEGYKSLGLLLPLFTRCIFTNDPELVPFGVLTST